MKFDLVRPCDNCPFRTDVVFHLRAERAKQIADDLLAGRTFQCHKTLTWTDDEDEEGEQICLQTPNDQHCAGAAIMLEHMGRPNQWMQISERMRWRDPSKLDMTAPVFKHAKHFVRVMRERDQ